VFFKPGQHFGERKGKARSMKDAIITKNKKPTYNTHKAAQKAIDSSQRIFLARDCVDWNV